LKVLGKIDSRTVKTAVRRAIFPLKISQKLLPARSEAFMKITVSKSIRQ
jgi:hypothetical protein